MKNLEGKVVIRIKPRENSDRSYMSSPIKIVKVLGSHAYYISASTPHVTILPADFCKASEWEECDSDMLKKMNCQFNEATGR